MSHLKCPWSVTACKLKSWNQSYGQNSFYCTSTSYICTKIIIIKKWHQIICKPEQNTEVHKHSVVCDIQGNKLSVSGQGLFSTAKVERLLCKLPTDWTLHENVNAYTYMCKLTGKNDGLFISEGLLCHVSNKSQVEKYVNLLNQHTLTMLQTHAGIRCVVFPQYQTLQIE